jgi:hypothetical protein
MRKINHIFFLILSFIPFEIVKAQEIADLSSESYLKAALEQNYVAKNWKSIEKLELAYFRLDSTKGNFAEALAHIKKQTEAADSASLSENVRKNAEFEMQLIFNKKQAADSVRVVNEKLVSAAELKSEKTKRSGLFGGIALLFLFAGFIYHRFRITQKQNKIIEEQKRLVEIQKDAVEEKQTMILDSIRYAKRIQKALIANETYIDRHLKRLGTDRK